MLLVPLEDCLIDGAGHFDPGSHPDHLVEQRLSVGLTQRQMTFH